MGVAGFIPRAILAFLWNPLSGATSLRKQGLQADTAAFHLAFAGPWQLNLLMQGAHSSPPSAATMTAAGFPPVYAPGSQAQPPINPFPLGPQPPTQGTAGVRPQLQASVPSVPAVMARGQPWGCLLPHQLLDFRLSIPQGLARAHPLRVQAPLNQRFFF